MYKLDLQSRVPIYQQLKSRITELILLGAIEAGDPLPSVRNMARELGVNPNTVSKAYQDLEREGIIYSIGGKGSFISGTDEFGKQARIASLAKLREAAAEGKLSGIPLADALSAVQGVYEEEADK